MTGSKQADNLAKAGPLDYKAKLDAAASPSRSSAPAENHQAGGLGEIIEKVSQHVPSISNMLGREGETPSTRTRPSSGPPDRPDNDTQISEFVRDQHKSTPIDAVESERLV